MITLSDDEHSSWLDKQFFTTKHTPNTTFPAPCPCCITPSTPLFCLSDQCLFNNDFEKSRGSIYINTASGRRKTLRERTVCVIRRDGGGGAMRIPVKTAHGKEGSISQTNIRQNFDLPAIESYEKVNSFCRSSRLKKNMMCECYR